MEQFVIKNGDDRPCLKATLYNPSGSVVDLTNATAQFILTSDQGVKLTKNALIQFPNDKGIVWVAFSKTDLDNFYGLCRGEIKVNFQDGKTETYPNNGYISVRVVKSL